MPAPHVLLRAGCLSSRPTNSIKALKATVTTGTENESGNQLAHVHQEKWL